MSHEPPNDADFARAVRAWIVAFALSAAMWALAIVGCIHLAGCATGHVRPDGEMVCAAIGEDARVTYSAPQGEPGIIQSAPTKLVACEGGPLVPSILDGVGSVVKAMLGWLWL